MFNTEKIYVFPNMNQIAKNSDSRKMTIQSCLNFKQMQIATGTLLSPKKLLKRTILRRCTRLRRNFRT